MEQLLISAKQHLVSWWSLIPFLLGCTFKEIITPTLRNFINKFIDNNSERKQVVWQEQREALKKMDKYMCEILQLVKRKSSVTIEEGNRIRLLLIESQMAVPKHIRKAFEKALPKMLLSNEPAKVVHKFRTLISKELNK